MIITDVITGVNETEIFFYSRGLFHNSEEAGMLVQAFLRDVSNNYAKTGTK